MSHAGEVLAAMTASSRCFASAVRTFLQRTPVTFPIGLAGLEGTELSRSLGNQVGGLPFSVVFGADGAVRQRRMGRVTQADLSAWVLAA